MERIKNTENQVFLDLKSYPAKVLNYKQTLI